MDAYRTHVLFLLKLQQIHRKLRELREFLLLRFLFFGSKAPQKSSNVEHTETSQKRRGGKLAERNCCCPELKEKLPLSFRTVPQFSRFRTKKRKLFFLREGRFTPTTFSMSRGKNRKWTFPQLGFLLFLTISGFLIAPLYAHQYK